MSATEALTEIINNIETDLDDVQFHQDSNSDYDEEFKKAFKSFVKHQVQTQGIQLANIFDSENRDKIEKDRQKSIELREVGNKYFQSDKYLEALECYNNSVILAPCPENLNHNCDFEDFAISLTNRAAVLGKMKCHQSAVEDLETSLKCGYPKHLRFKAFQRLTVAYTALKDTEKARANYKLLFKALDDSDLPGDKVKKMKNDCCQAVKKLGTPCIKTQESSKTIPDSLSNSLFSDKIEIQETESRGRFSVAKETIMAGDLIINESASIINVAPSRMTSHCFTCGRDTLTSFPCHQCCYVRFCSLACRQEGLVHHVKQCKISHVLASPTDIDNDLTHILAVLNLLLKHSISDHIRTFQEWKTGTTGDETLMKILQMVKHFDQLDLRHHFASSLLILEILKYLDYIQKDQDAEDMSHLTTIICHYLAVIKSNIHTISELHNGNDNHFVIKPVGVGMFPAVASHLNHSCNPNTFVVDVGTKQLTIAARDIQPGEEVTQIYVGHYGDTDKEKRQRLLWEKYHFICGCQACQEDFPDADKCLEMCKTFSETPQAFLKSELSQKELEALDDKNGELKSLVESALARGHIAQAVELTKQRIHLASLHLKEPHILYITGRVSLVNYMWFQYGNRSRWFKNVLLPTYY